MSRKLEENLVVVEKLRQARALVIMMIMMMMLIMMMMIMMMIRRIVVVIWCWLWWWWYVDAGDIIDESVWGFFDMSHHILNQRGNPWQLDGNFYWVLREKDGKYVSCVFVPQKLDSSNAGLEKDQCIQTCREFRLMKLKRTEEKFQQFVSYYFIKESLFHWKLRCD